MRFMQITSTIIATVAARSLSACATKVWTQDEIKMDLVTKSDWDICYRSRYTVYEYAQDGFFAPQWDTRSIATALVRELGITCDYARMAEVHAIEEAASARRMAASMQAASNAIANINSTVGYQPARTSSYGSVGASPYSAATVQPNGSFTTVGAGVLKNQRVYGNKRYCSYAGLSGDTVVTLSAAQMCPSRN